MEKVVRFGVSLEPKLLEKFDDLIEKKVTLTDPRPSVT